MFKTIIMVVLVFSTVGVRCGRAIQTDAIVFPYTQTGPASSRQPLTGAAELQSAKLTLPGGGLTVSDQSPTLLPNRFESIEGGPPAPPLPATACQCGRCVNWAKVPLTISPMPRPGAFPVPVKQGPGFFSALDQVTGQCRSAAPKSGYAPFAINAWPMFDADWRFVDSIDPEKRNAVERLKRIRPNQDWLLSVGGENWIKYHNERNSRLSETDNDFTLYRTRIYSDLSYRDRLRVFGEYLWADIQGNELSPLGPDVDKGDIQNLFVDLNWFEFGDAPVFLRAGRQELLYGSQRLITPLPWANKRHSFDGVKVFRHGDTWNWDLFWTKFVPASADALNDLDENRTLAGSWFSLKPQQGETVDFYLLYSNDRNAVLQNGIVRAPNETYTTGSRWAGNRDTFLWDFEGAMQLGQQGGSDILAGMATAGIGRNIKHARWNPTAWIYYDFASGDSDPTAGHVNTFNPLFPFGHYYLGWVDAVGRQNIHDVNAHLYLYPAPWCTVWLQYHHLRLANERDALYNAGGGAIRRDPTGNSGSHVGDEVDVVLNFHLTQYSDILVSYNQLFGGDFLRGTAGAAAAADADSLYLIYQHRW